MKIRSGRVSSQQLQWGIILVLLSLVLILRGVWILRSSMQWGVMDDVSWVALFTANPFLDFNSFLKNHLESDLSWGLIRPTYFGWVYLIYKLLGVLLTVRPSLLYALCFLIHLLCGIGFSLVFLKLDEESSVKRVSKLFRFNLFFLLFWSFTPGLNLVNLISLQERLALVFVLGAFLLLLFGHGLNGLRVVLAYICFFLALGAKSTSVVFSLPLAYLLFRKDRRVGWPFALLFLTTGAVWGLLAAWVARSGVYTSRYRFSFEMFGKYFQVGGVWAPIVLGVAIVSFLILWKKKLHGTLQVIWPLSVLGLICLMLPWGIYGYYWSIFTPFVAGCFSICFMNFYGRVDTRILLIVPLIGFAVSIGPKLQKLVNRSVSTAAMTEWISTTAEGQIFIPVPCYEAANSISTLSKHSVKVWSDSEEIPPSGALFLTWWECSALPSLSGRTFQLVHDFGDWKVFSAI